MAAVDRAKSRLIERSPLHHEFESVPSPGWPAGSAKSRRQASVWSGRSQRSFESREVCDAARLRLPFQTKSGRRRSCTDFLRGTLEFRLRRLRTPDELPQIFSQIDNPP